MGSAKEDTCKLQETDFATFKSPCIGAKIYIYRSRFEQHDRVTNKMMIRFCLNTKNKIRHKRFR